MPFHSNLKRGSLILHGPQGPIAIIYKEGENDRARVVPPGRYRFQTARVERQHKKDYWLLSTTGPPIKARRAILGKSLTINVADQVHFRGNLVRTKRGPRISFGFQMKAAIAGRGRGLAIYKNDKRIPISYELLSKNDEVLRKGKLEYG